MLSNKTVEEVKRIVNVKDIIEKYVKIKRSGRRYVCCCPFHHENTPSFFISEDNNFYKCFGCGESGDAITFVEKMENVSFIEAIEIIAKEYNISIEEEETYNNDEEERIYKEKKEIKILLNEVVKFFNDNLKDNEVAKKYLENRNIDKKTIEEFNIGYSNGNLFNFLKSNNLNIELAKKIGLLNYNYEEVFRERIMIPIYDSRNNILGFGGRIFNVNNNDDNNKDKNKKENTPKYINSVDNILFHKNECLFNINLAKEHILNNKKVYLVEGYFDAISLYKSGIKNVVASCGTGFTNNQCKLLKRFTNQITIFYDNDEAGQKATLIAIEKILPYNIMVNVVKIDKFKDPDELINNIEQSKLLNYINEKEFNFIEYLINIFNYKSEKDLNKKNIILNNINRLINLITDDIYKSLIIENFKKLTNINITNIIKKDNNCDKNINIINSKINLIEEYEIEILKFILNLIDQNIFNKDVIEFIKKELDDINFKNNDVKNIINFIIDKFNENGNFNLKYIINEVDENLKSTIINYICDCKNKISDNWTKTDLFKINKNQDNLFENIKKIFLRLKLNIIKELIKNFKKNIKENKLNEDNIKSLNLLKNKEIEIAKFLKIIIL